MNNASAVRLNEFLPYPKLSYSKEWVELANDGELGADLGEWAIDDASGGGTPYRLPTGTLLAAHGLVLVELPKALLNNSGDTLRLLKPDGSVVDQYQFKQAAADMSFCRMQQSWRACAPSPRQPNEAEHAAPEPPAPEQARAEQSTPLDDTAPDLHITVQHTAERHAGSATLQSMAWLRADSSPAPAYALPGRGALYSGLAKYTPTSRPATPTITPSIGPTLAANPNSTGTASPPLSAAIGTMLLVVSGVAAGYDRLRRRRQSSAPEASKPADAQRQDDPTPESML